MLTPFAFLRCWLLFALLGPAVASVPDAPSFAAAARANPNLAASDGEQFCWHASAAADSFLEGYEATRDPRWLEEAQGYYDFLLGKLTRDPDGREGWIGRSIWDSPAGKFAAYRTDALVGDAILLAPMVRFAEIVRADPALDARFGAAAGRYVEKARQIGWEKWNARGAYYRDAAGYGSYHMPEKFIDATTGQWVPSPVPAQSENLNKHSAMALVMLRLGRVTGDERYRQRAEEIFSRLKALFRYYPGEDRVTWNFWMPHGPYDVADGKLRSWVGVHPKRPAYQTEEVARMVEAYDSGVVFDEADLRRLIRTNHFMMPAAPGEKWRSSDGSSDAGKVWPALARFDARIRAAWRAGLQASGKPQDAVELAYDDAVTATYLNWARRYVGDSARVRVPDHPPQPGVALGATVIIPDRLDLAEGGKTTLVTQTKAEGELVIELLDATGRTVLGELHRQKMTAAPTIVLPEWDGTIPQGSRREAGRYLVRWRLGDEIRTEKIQLVAPAAVPPPALEAGEAWAELAAVAANEQQDPYVPANATDGDLATRWTAGGSAAWLSVDLGHAREVVAVDLSFTQGDRRNAFFRLEASVDGATWTKLFEGSSAGKTAGFERIRVSPTAARWIRFAGYGNSVNEWNSLNEVRVVVPQAEAKS